MVEKDIVYARMDSPVGAVWLASTDEGLCAVGLGVEQPERLWDWLIRHFGVKSPVEDADALGFAIAQLDEYFSGERRAFDLPLDVRGTDFQKAVWDEVASVPYGVTATYGEIARRIGRAGAARAVGAALGANPLPVLVPCHRVIGANGALVGYGAGLEIKAALLQMEGAV